MIKKNALVNLRIEKYIREEAKKLGVCMSTEARKAILQAIEIKKGQHLGQTTDGNGSHQTATRTQPNIRRPSKPNTEHHESNTSTCQSDSRELETLTGPDSSPTETQGSEIYFDQLYCD